MAKKEKETKQKSNYLKDMKVELKKVVWPTPRELINNTVAVIIFVVIISAIVFILDFCFDNLNKYGIAPLQEKVQTTFQTTEKEEEKEGENEEASNEGEAKTENDENGNKTEKEPEVEAQAEGSKSDENKEENKNVETNQ